MSPLRTTSRLACDSLSTSTHRSRASNFSVRPRVASVHTLEVVEEPSTHGSSIHEAANAPQEDDLEFQKRNLWGSVSWSDSSDKGEWGPVQDALTDAWLYLRNYFAGSFSARIWVPPLLVFLVLVLIAEIAVWQAAVAYEASSRAAANSMLSITVARVDAKLIAMQVPLGIMSAAVLQVRAKHVHLSMRETWCERECVCGSHPSSSLPTFIPFAPLSRSIVPFPSQQTPNVPDLERDWLNIVILVNSSVADRNPNQTATISLIPWGVNACVWPPLPGEGKRLCMNVCVCVLCVYVCMCVCVCARVCGSMQCGHFTPHCISCRNGLDDWDFPSKQ